MSTGKSLKYALQENWFLIAAFVTCGVMIAFNFVRGRWWSGFGTLGILAFVVIANWLTLYRFGQKVNQIAEDDDGVLN